MVALLERAIRHIHPPGSPHLRTFTSLTAASQGEALLSMLSLAFLVRLTGTDTAGQLIFAQALSSVWFLLLDPRLEDAAQRYVPIEQQRNGRGSALYACLLRWDVAIGAAAGGVGLLAVLTTWLLGLTTGDLTLMLALALVSGGAVASSGAAGAAFALASRLRDLGLLRLRCAVLSFGLSLGGLLSGGPVAYLAGQTVGAVVTTAVLGRMSLRVVFAHLGPATTRARLPAGLVAFTAKASAGTSVAAMSESGVLTLAGFLGDPALVTILKIASAPSRLYTSLISPITSMLYPRLARAAASGETALIRRDAVRTTLTLTVVGTMAIAAAIPVAGDVLGLVYGAPYVHAGQTAVLLLGVACVKGGTSWSKVLPMAVGKPSWRLVYLSIEGVLLFALLLLAHRAAPGVARTSLAFGWGALILAVLGTGFWIIWLRRLTVIGDV